MKKPVKNEVLWLAGLGSLALFALGRKRAASLVAAGGLWALTRKTEKTSFEGHSVIITGGSRGLGFALARELVRENANVTLLARDGEELRKAQKSLEKIGGVVHIIPCDVTDSRKLERAFDEVARIFGGIDLLINNAGSITVGPWETLSFEDFEAQMKLHLYAPIRATRFALPYLREANSGKRIVNICSMGGRMAVPHMLAYDTSKFALSGFSQGVAAELAKDGISVTTVYPALMRTGSPIQAVFKGDHEKEFAWFQASDVLPGLSISAESAARSILDAARDRCVELVPSFPAKVRNVAAQLFPELMGAAMDLLNRAMPEGDSTEYKTGAQSRKLFDKSIWTRLFKSRAHEPEKELNQRPKRDPLFNMGLN